MFNPFKIILATLLGIPTFCCGQTAYEDADPDRFYQIGFTDSMQLIDVRTQAEYDEGHLPFAVLIDVTKPAFLSRAMQHLDTTRPVFVYCRSGKRSARAASLLAAKGFRVINLKGGILAWIRAQYPVIKDESQWPHSYKHFANNKGIKILHVPLPIKYKKRCNLFSYNVP